MRVPFSTVFQCNPDGSVTPKTDVVIGGEKLSRAISFAAGDCLLGIDVTAHSGRDLEMERRGDSVEIKGIYL